MRVLVGMPIAHALGGAERLLRTLALRGGEAGLDFHVCFLENGPLERELANAGLRTSVVEVGRFREVTKGARAVRRLAALLESERPAVALSWLPRAQVYLAPAAGLARVRARVAWWQHHTGDGEEGLVRFATALPAAAVVCTSQAAADRQSARRPRRPLLVCHPGVPEPAVPPQEALTALRDRLGLSPGDLVLGLPGRLVPWKGQDRFLEALAILRGRGHRVAGLVVGGNSYDLAPGYEERLHGRAAELGVPCTFTGHVADPAPYLAAMDILVNASESEPFGMTLAEGMALGVPVLAVDAGGPREIVDPGVSGVLIADGQAETLAGGLERLIADAALRTRLGAGGRMRYAERFTAEAFVVRAAGTLRRIAGGP